MQKIIETLKTFLSPPLDGELLELKEGMNFFKLTNFETDLDTTKREFINKLSSNTYPGYKLDNYGSAIYSFKTGSSGIEIEITVDGNKVFVFPSVIYSEENAKSDFVKLMNLDLIIYSTLRRFGLQKR